MNHEAINNLHDELVPVQGPAETAEGELVRAVSRVGYRYFNDGDYFFEGYGCETAGPSATFLMEREEVPGLVEAVKEATGYRGKKYEEAVDKMIAAVVSYVESKRGNFSENTRDSRLHGSLWEEEQNLDEDEDF